MELTDITSIDNCEAYIEGVLNDFELGIISKSDAMKCFGEYTIFIAEKAVKGHNDKSKVTEMLEFLDIFVRACYRGCSGSQVDQMRIKAEKLIKESTTNK